MIKKGKLILSTLGILLLLFILQITFNSKVAANSEIPIDETSFPDNRFVNALKETYPKYTEDNILTEDELKKITSLDLSMQGIQNLKGIEYFKYLTFLNLEVNNLVSLDLRQNSNLTTLEISNNQLLTSLQLPENIVNVYMNFSTKLKNFSISDYKNLKLFYAADVPLNQVDISNLTELVALDLENTGIKNIDTTNNLKLEYLNVSSNGLEQLDVSKNDNLTTLKVTGNKLSKLYLPNNNKNNVTVEYYAQQVEDGYEISWYNGDNLILQNEKISMKGQVLSSKISAKPYQIVYNANGGSGSMTYQEITFGENAILKQNTFTRRGYTFVGWSLAQNSESVTYQDKEEILLSTYPNKGKVTLYAVWKPIQYSIEFVDYYGEGSIDKINNLSYGKVYKLPEYNFSREGYIFKGWTTKEGSQVAQYANKVSISNLTAENGKTVKLYAVWEKKSYSIYLNIDGKTQSNTVKYGEKLSKSSNPIKTGYTFLGWYNSKTNAKYDFNQKVTNSFTLVAKWKVNTYTIVFNGNQAKQNMNSIKLNYNQSYTLPENSFQKVGYKFKGWSLSSNGNVKYTNKSTIKNLTAKDGETIILYAQWEKIKKNFSIRVSNISTVYNGKAHTIQLRNVPSGSTILYRTSTNGKWVTTKPTRTSVGTTTVYYKITNADYVTLEGSSKITITAKNIKNLSISNIGNKTYTGKQIRPGVTVKDGKTVLKSGTNYTISYGTNKNTGKGYVKITGKGNYTGTITKYFYIVPKVPSVSISAGKGSISITAKSTGASGYEILYSTSRNGKYTTIRTTNSKRSITRLTRKKNYYIKVRAYKVIDGKRVYSNFSSIRVVRTK